MSTPTGSGKDLHNLDFLRATAVMCVLIHHIALAKRWTPYGMGYGGFGVCLFFVHTSLVLMWSLERRPDTLDFYVRRAARIYPLAIVAVLMVALTHAPVASFGAHDPFFRYVHPTHKQFIEHLLLVQNLFSGNFMLYVLWSLPIEVQMYLVLPPLFFFLRHHKAIWPLALFWLLAIAFAHHSFAAQEMNLVVAAPFFLAGLMAYVGFSRPRRTLPGWTFPLFLAAIVWMGGHVAGWLQAAVPCLLLGLGLPFFRQLQNRALTSTSWQIARYSYGIYLLHPFSLWCGFVLCQNQRLWVQFAVLFGTLALFSFLSYHLVETPFIRLAPRISVAIEERLRSKRAAAT